MTAKRCWITNTDLLGDSLLNATTLPTGGGIQYYLTFSKRRFSDLVSSKLEKSPPHALIDKKMYDKKITLPFDIAYPRQLSSW
jgi:hypothetical protein